MSITVNLPDGRRITVQTDDPGEAARVAHGYGQRTAAPDHSAWNTAAGVAGHYLDAMLPGASGFVRGAREIVKNAAEAPFSSSVDFHPLQSYRDGQRFQEAREKDADIRHPTASAAASAAGLMGSLALPVAKIARGATLGAKALAGAKTAGLYGLASGAMSSKADGPGGILSDALGSGATAAGTGAALPIAAKVAGIAGAPLRPLTEKASNIVGMGLQGLGGSLPAGLAPPSA